MVNVIKVPIYDSYLQIQEAAKEEATYLNSSIAFVLQKKGISYNLGILLDAARQPAKYKLDKGIAACEIEWGMFLKLNGGVSFDRATFEAWYHSVHPDGIERKKFFSHLTEAERQQLSCSEVSD